MFGKRIDLFTIFGFSVKADLSWLVIAALVTWSLAVGAFPFWYEGLSTGTYWIMGVFGAVGLFFSILIHELSHSLVGRRYGVVMKGITLWIFGGIAEMTQEAESPKAEWRMAIAGPLASFALAAVLYGVNLLGEAVAWPTPFVGVVAYLAWLNLILGIFNLVPGYPLDGGRILRAMVWKRTGDVIRSTRIASKVGNGFGWVLIGLGALSIMRGAFVGGLWWILIGSFVRGAAKSSYQQLLARKVLEEAPVRRLMNREPAPVERGTSIARFVEDYVYGRRGGLFPVTDHERVVGYVDADTVRQIPRDEWERRTIDEVTQQLTDENAIAADADAGEALQRLQTSGRKNLLVTSNGHLEGIVSVEDLQRYLALRSQFEGEQGPRA